MQYSDSFLTYGKIAEADFSRAALRDYSWVKEIGKVAVLVGGDSHEREISLLSGKAVLKSLKEAGVDVHAVEWDMIGKKELLKGNYARVFVALHGNLGEDGCTQGFLETLGIPYTGSGVTASALCMDKIKLKYFLRGAGLPTLPFKVLESMFEPQDIVDELGLPVCIKSSNGGSSQGVTKVMYVRELRKAWEHALKYHSAVIAEPWVDSGEYTVGFLNGLPMPVIKIEPQNGFYDYKAKYLEKTTKYLCPCGLTDDETKNITEIASQAFVAAGCRDWGRVDFVRDHHGDFKILEINTVPGMTETSLVPKAAKALGISFEDLVLQILWNARVDLPS